MIWITYKLAPFPASVSWVSESSQCRSSLILLSILHSRHLTLLLGLLSSMSHRPSPLNLPLLFPIPISQGPCHSPAPK